MLSLMVQHAFLENDIVNNLVILNSYLKDIVNHLQDIFSQWDYNPNIFWLILSCNLILTYLFSCPLSTGKNCLLCMRHGFWRVSFLNTYCLYFLSILTNHGNEVTCNLRCHEISPRKCFPVKHMGNTYACNSFLSFNPW